MKKLLFFAAILTIAVSSCNLFDKQSGKTDIERKRDSIQRADSLKKVRLEMKRKKQEQARIAAEKKAKAERAKRLNAKYQIISGSFKVQKNADAYLDLMKQKGFDAIMLKGQYNFSLVSIQGFDDRKMAIAALKEAKKTSQNNEEFWIFEMN